MLRNVNNFNAPQYFVLKLKHKLEGVKIYDFKVKAREIKVPLPSGGGGKRCVSLLSGTEPLFREGIEL